MDNNGDLDAEDFAKFARAFPGIGGEKGCPCCGASSWEFHKEQDGRSYALLGMERANPQIAGADIAWVLVMVCKRCGYLSTFLRARVEQWLDENR